MDITRPNRSSIVKKKRTTVRLLFVNMKNFSVIMEDEEFVGCISCMSTNDLCDLFAVYTENVETYGKMLETCFELKLTNNVKYICSPCAEKLINAVQFKEGTVKTINMIQSIKDEEYLDESILEDADDEAEKDNIIKKSDINDNFDADVIMEDEEFVGCISCMSTNDLCDLFAVYTENVETYGKMLETCFELKLTNNVKYICSPCAEKLINAVQFKEGTVKTINMIQSIKDEEYLDESILEDADDEAEKDNIIKKSDINDNFDADDEIDDEHAIQALDETTCIYCDLQLSTVEEIHEHIRTVHELEPRTGLRLRECSLCGVPMRDPADHHNRCHGIKSENVSRRYPCHFCDNVYISKKACFTHLRMKHGLKLCNDQTPKIVPRERKKCHLCNRDFSQKQILNKHLWKVHGLEVEKRKAFICPLCNERVSYGSNFSAHLLHVHRVNEQVEELEFHDMDEFMLFKTAIQEETKYRFRKTTASKQTIEGVRSHYMCSQSGVYVYQGKGKRPAPERQIYKTGKACPAHMIVTETMDRVLITFYKTHVGHGTCPYFEPREPKKLKLEPLPTTSMLSDSDVKSEIDPKDDGDTVVDSAWICDACGIAFLDAEKFREHASSHGLNMFPCQYCEDDFHDLDAWTHHVRIKHNMSSLF